MPSFINWIYDKIPLTYNHKENKHQLEQKSYHTNQFFKLFTNYDPHWSNRNYTSFINEGYCKNPIVYRCVRMIAEAASSISFTIKINNQNITEHPILELLQNPNHSQSGPELLESLYGYLQLSGNAYIEAVQINNKIAELYVLRPDRIKVISGANGWPNAFEYQVDDKTIRYENDNYNKPPPIYHLTLFHPDNDHYGLSPLNAAANAIDIHNAASSWNKALFDNAARPSGALIYQNNDGNSNLTDEQFDRLKSELEEAYQGVRNAGRPMLLEGGLDWKSMSYSPSDMDFNNLNSMVSREIALAFGIPTMLLGIPGDNTYSNYSEANRAFWRQTILPLVNKVSRALTKWLSQYHNEQIEISYDVNKIDALSKERENLWNRLNTANFLTEDEKRAIIGYAPKS